MKLFTYTIMLLSFTVMPFYSNMAQGASIGEETPSATSAEKSRRACAVALDTASLKEARRKALNNRHLYNSFIASSAGISTAFLFALVGVSDLVPVEVSDALLAGGIITATAFFSFFISDRFPSLLKTEALRKHTEFIFEDEPQGLAHALFPNPGATRDLSTALLRQHFNNFVLVKRSDASQEPFEITREPVLQIILDRDQPEGMTPPTLKLHVVKNNIGPDSLEEPLRFLRPDEAEDAKVALGAASSFEQENNIENSTSAGVGFSSSLNSILQSMSNHGAVCMVTVHWNVLTKYPIICLNNVNKEDMGGEVLETRAVKVKGRHSTIYTTQTNHFITENGIYFVTSHV